MKKNYILYSLAALIILLFSGCVKASPVVSKPEPTVTNPVTPTPSITRGLTVTAIPKPTITVIPNSSESDTKSFDTTAKEILSKMTLEEKVGQMFFVRCNQDSAETDIEKYYLGGYILFANDFEDQTKLSIKSTIKNFQSYAKIPMLIGVDEEGGTVNRVSKYPAFRSTPFQSPQELYQDGGFDTIANDTIEKAKLLKSLGINVNLAPVCDVSTDSKDFIYERSFGKDAKSTAEYVTTVVTEMNAMGIGSTLKHFPGYGNNVDTHTGIAIDERSYDTFEKSDFLPFEAGMKAGAGSILVSHNIVKSMDKNLPASLSPNVHRILRDTLGFQGVIMTDDLSMDAITKYTNSEDAAVLAIKAGNDLLVTSDYKNQINAVVTAVMKKTISMDQINDSVIRILKWKLSLGIIN